MVFKGFFVFLIRRFQVKKTLKGLVSST